MKNIKIKKEAKNTFKTHEIELHKINKLINYGRLSNNTLMAINRIKHGLELNERHDYSLKSMIDFLDQAIIGEEQIKEDTYTLTSTSVSNLNAFNRMAVYGLRNIVNNGTEESEIREFLLNLKKTLTSFLEKSFDSVKEENIDLLIDVLDSLSESYSKEISQLTIEEVHPKQWQPREKTTIR